MQYSSYEIAETFNTTSIAYSLRNVVGGKPKTHDAHAVVAHCIKGWAFTSLEEELDYEQAGAVADDWFDLIRN